MSEYQNLRSAGYVILRDEGKVLLMKRQNTGFRDGYWSVPAGHVDQGEDLKTATVRETKEEIGVELSKENLVPHSVIHRDSDESVYFDVFFISEEWKGEIKNMEPEKCEQLEWFSIDNLPEKTISYVRKALYEDDDLSYFQHGW